MTLIHRIKAEKIRQRMSAQHENRAFILRQKIPAIPTGLLTLAKLPAPSC